MINYPVLKVLIGSTVIKERTFWLEVQVKIKFWVESKATGSLEIASISKLRKAPSTNTMTLCLASCCLRCRNIWSTIIPKTQKHWIYISKRKRLRMKLWNWREKKILAHWLKKLYRSKTGLEKSSTCGAYWRWHSDLPSQRGTRVLKTTVIARQIGVGSLLLNGSCCGY